MYFSALSNLGMSKSKKQGAFLDSWSQNKQSVCCVYKKITKKKRTSPVFSTVYNNI